MSKPLETYRAKRNFSKTPEPAGSRMPPAGGNSYVIQKHAARRLHYDFRLELNGVLKSWAVPEGPSLVVGKKRLAVEVEDHPLEYGGFEGVIPKGQYGGGTVMLWDRGTWTPEFDPEFGLRKGHLRFRLDGEKLKGDWHLVRMARRPREKHDSWLLFKSEDAAARREGAPDILEEQPLSVATGRDIDAIARDHDRVWSSSQGEIATPPAASKPASPRSTVVARDIPHAKKAAILPPFVEPCLPTAVDRPPTGSRWVHEIKHDGYRLQLRIDDGKLALLTRQGLDWTERFRPIAHAARALPVRSTLIDGEVVVQTASGVASFAALHDQASAGQGVLVFHAFDLLFLDGYDLRGAPLTARKDALERLVSAVGGGSAIRYSEHLTGDGAKIFAHAARLGLEGIVSKQADSTYRSGRVKSWLKIKSADEGPFVIAGYVPSTVAKHAVGALVLAEHVAGKLVPSGHVGSGFSAATAHELWRTLDPLRRPSAPIKDQTAVAKGAKWVEPRLVADIEYRGRTGAGLIRHATFRDLAQGKRAEEVARPDGVAGGATPEPAVRLTNPGRLLWPQQGVTKQGLADFYGEIADWILPHLVGRPLSMLRCPEGVTAQCFFQKHPWAGLGSSVRRVAVPGDDQPMMVIDDLNGLLELVQASVLELHPWGAREGDLERPDRATIDLDPGDNVPWQAVIDAALDVRDRLRDQGLESFVKTTGGKGLHVVFPLVPDADWPTLKAFAQALSERMAADRPERYTANMAKRTRHGRIYVDYLRNGMGATAVAAYSTRARPGAPIATPLAWDELEAGIRADHFNVENLGRRLTALLTDPWADLPKVKQKLPGR